MLPCLVPAKSFQILKLAAIGAILAVAFSPTPAETPSLSQDSKGYEKIITPFFSTHCSKCHTGDKPKGGFSTETKKLPNDFLDPASKSRWKEVVNVLNSHEMPPKKEKQPDSREVATVVDWITDQMVRSEQTRRENTIILRRLNRDEYRNTIRDLTAIDFDISGFPQDPPAGGFDNNGSALTLSPLHLETYLNAARQILDRALVEGPQPQPIKWRFNPKAGRMDATRVRLDPKNNPIVNGNNNKQEGDWVVVHHNSWDKNIGARDFRVPVAGNYILRVKAAGRVPNREAVVKSANTILTKRKDDQDKQNPKGAKYHIDQLERDLKHFQNDLMYDYGPPRIRIIQQLGPLPRPIAEFDAEGTPMAPKIHEIKARFTTESAGVSFEYAYSLPRVLENFWMQGQEGFARPELMIEWFEIEGPVYDSWPPASHSRILPESTQKPGNEQNQAEVALKEFMRKAFRRPVTDSEVNEKLRHFLTARAEGASFVEAIKRSLVSVLVSPHFLFLAESGQSTAKLRPLNDHELATRMSYFLWSSMPDNELSALADHGKLSDKKERIRQVDRMLADPKSEAFTRNFAGQWLNLRDVGANPPAQDLFPQYDRHLETSMVKESEAFFREILDSNLDLQTFIRSDFVTINERLARFYGIRGVKGDHFRKVPVPPEVTRGGIMTQASILTTTSNGTRTSPVKRGTWILKTLLGIDPGLPVANAGEIAPKVPGIDKATVRKRLEIHRTLDQCARCHNKIDPLGFALENYNAAGEWRDQEGFGYRGRIEKNDPKIDSSSEMIDGTRITGVRGLQEAMIRQEDLFFQCLASKLFTYALGREMGLADQPALKTAQTEMKNDGRTLRALIRQVVVSEAFGTK